MRVHFEQKAAKEEKRQNTALRGALKASEYKGKNLRRYIKYTCMYTTVDTYIPQRWVNDKSAGR